MFCGLLWGSFLNSLAYRLINLETLLRKRSFCPACDSRINWHDLIPVVSYIILGGKCRSCHSPISHLYPAVELLTAAIFGALATCVHPRFWFANFMFSSALIIALRTDLEYFLISRFSSLFLVPVGWLLAWCNLLPISFFESFVTSIGCFGLLWIIRAVHHYLSGKEGLGLGDADLLALIGSFTGFYGAWFSLNIGSIAAIIAVLIYGTIKRTPLSRGLRIPLGAFLSLATLLYIIIGAHCMQWLFCC